MQVIYCAYFFYHLLSSHFRRNTSTDTLSTLLMSLDGTSNNGRYKQEENLLRIDKP